MIFYENEWAAADYSSGDTVTHGGIVFEALEAIASSVTTTPIQDAFTRWKIVGVQRITDAYSLYADIFLTLNDASDDVRHSIPSFMQEAQIKLSKTLKLPVQKTQVTTNLDSEGKFQMPDNLLSVDNIRFNGEKQVFATLEDKGYITIREADKEEYETLRQTYARSYDALGYDNPVFYVSDAFAYVTPYPSNAQVQISYYKEEPLLFSKLAQTDGSTTTVTGNSYVVQVPHLLKIGALVAAEGFVNDPQRVAAWKQEYQQALIETIKLYSDYESQPQHVSWNTSYNI